VAWGGAGVVVWDCGGSGRGYACDAVVAAAGVDSRDCAGEGGAGFDEDHSPGSVDRVFT